jgi:hypothetical protein
MDRVVLLALLGIPILIIIHVALFSPELPSGLAMASPASQLDRELPVLQGHWQQPEPVGPARLAIKHTTERGS